MKAIILAAGRDPDEHGTYPWVLQPLGDKRILDYVVDLALRVVSPDDLIVVVGARGDEVREHLGNRYCYVDQREPLGTGHAVLQARSALADYDGDLLILYGDTPLLRYSSIRGLIIKHQMKQACLTLLTVETDQKLPYGRIIRDDNGNIVDVVEEVDASPQEQQITELNVGAYVVRASLLFPALEQLERECPGEVRLTDSVRHLLRSAGCTVASYRTVDQEEILGINTPEDRDQAAFILQKRLMRPRRHEEENEIRFGTGGWRAVIGEGFTLHNVRRLSQALANDLIRNNREDEGVLIGYDRRFLSDFAARAAAEVFAGNNIPVVLLTESAPTPLVTYATAMLRSAYGLVFTASHNPPEWNGLKVFISDGSLILDDAARIVEAEANQLSTNDVAKIELELAQRAGVVKREDYTNAYVDAVESLIDMEAIRNAGLRVVLDPMYGVGQVTLEIILTEARCRVVTIHGRHDPLFGGRSPAPDLHALGLLITLMKEGHYDLGLAMDGDADRIAIVDDRGEYISTNDLLLLLYYYLHELRGDRRQRGGVVRNLATTHLLDRLAAHLGEESYEVPVGFKHIAATMKAHDILLGGESSGGLTIRGHILGKDGIFASALVAEMLARTGRRIADLLEEVYSITGRLVTAEENVPATPGMRVAVPRILSSMTINEIAGYPVRRVSHIDGTKFYLDNDNWLLLRFSGTEPLLRIMTEADTAEKAQELIAWAKDVIHIDEQS
ncbi:MAG: NTP transferase domain-containing protein [Anaerolineae bacterium]|nr:NTP transferase domain-containing protein [Anaerolineae bacterium]